MTGGKRTSAWCMLSSISFAGISSAFRPSSAASIGSEEPEDDEDDEEDCVDEPETGFSESSTPGTASFSCAVPSLEVMPLSTLYADCYGNIDERMRMHIHSASVALTYRGSLRARWNAALVGLIVVLLHVCGTLVYCLVSRSRVSSSCQEVCGRSTKDNGGTHGPS